MSTVAVVLSWSRIYLLLMNESASNARRALDGASSLLLTTHVNPDGDAMGSLLGLASILRSQGKRVTTVVPTRAPSNLTWMPGADTTLVWTGSPEQRQVLDSKEAIVVLDLNDLGRLGDLGEAIRSASATTINIDHHTHPEDFADVQWIDTDAPAVCAMLADLYADTTIPSDGAMCLYAGLMTDTGSFRFPRTTEHTFDQASRLVAQGADPVAAYEQIMNTNSFAREVLLGASLRGMQLHHDGRLCVMTVRQQDFAETGTQVDDTDGFVHHTLSIQGVQMGLLLIELEDQIKCSFRSKGDVYVRDLAAAHGGGGHVYAAGARIHGMSMDTAISTIVAESLSALDAGSSR